LTAAAGSTPAKTSKRIARRRGQISLNTAAVERPALISEGAEPLAYRAIIVAIERGGAPQYSIKRVTFHPRGRKNVGWDAVEWALRAELTGAGEILLTTWPGRQRATI